MPDVTCLESICGRKASRRGFCQNHYEKHRKSGKLPLREVGPRVTRPDETWVSVVGYEGRYEVSSFGSVYSLKWGMLKPFHSATAAYPTVGLYLNRVLRQHEVHTLVARAFLGPYPDGQEVRHLDGDSMNPRVENLAFGTHVENMQDMVRHGRSQTRAKRAEAS